MYALNDCYILKNGVRIPCVGYGTWQATTQTALEAIACGYRLIDTAALHGNEEAMGLAVRESGVPREEVFVTTKLLNTVGGYEETLEAFDASLKRLGLDYCDLYLIHWPNPVHFRDRWQQRNEQVWRAMEKLYNEGVIRAIGMSNFRKHHIDALLKSASVMPMVNQLHLNPAVGQKELVETCHALGMVVEAYSPLGRGTLLQQPEIVACAEAHHITTAQVCLRWSLQHGFLPLPKSANAQRIRNNADLFGFSLNDEEMKMLDGVEARFEGHFDYTGDPDTIQF